MKFKMTGLVLGVAFVAFGSERAWASTAICTSNLILYAFSQSDSGSDAHMVEVNSSACSSACTVSGTKRMYVQFEDKQLYAAVLAAAEAGTNYNLAFETSASSKGNGVHGYVTCKLLSIWK